MMLGMGNEADLGFLRSKLSFSNASFLAAANAIF
jgi:hypothetical protein